MKSIADILGLHRQAQPDGAKEQNLHKVRAYLKANNLSTIPALLTRIDALCRDPNVGAEAFAAVYQMDKSSSARLVRTANSVLYAPREGTAIINIRDAVLRVGFEKAREILHASTVCGLYKAHLTVGDYSAVELWKHSMAVALGTRMIYREIIKGVQPPADPYLAGLLHDLGISIEHACLYHEGFAGAILARQEQDTNLVVQEQKHLAVTHPEVGMELARNWKFPPGLMAVIEFHHAPGAAPEAMRQLVHAVRASEWLCLTAKLGYSDIATGEHPAFLESFNAIGVNEGAIETLMTGLTAEFDTLNAMGWFSGLQLKR